MSPPRLTVVATGNANRRAEIAAAFAAWGIEVLAPGQLLAEVPPLPSAAPNLEEAALLKAKALAESTAHVALGHAIGLEVEALGGRPGVRSKRLAGEGATDAENNAELLRQLDEVDGEHRRAQYRAVIAIVDPWSDGEPLVAEGICRGRIERKPSGAGGYGYDALFLADGQTSTLGELSTEQRRPLSHFHRALEALRPSFEAILAGRLGATR